MIVADRANNRVEVFDGVAQPTTCAPPPPAVPAQRLGLTVRLVSASGILESRVVSLEVTCDRICAVSAAARVAVRTAAHTDLASGPVRLHPGVGTRIDLPLTDHGVTLLRKALHKRRGLTAAITVRGTAIVPAGGVPVAAGVYRSTAMLTR